MRKLVLLLFFTLLSNLQLVKGQDLESQELLKLRNQDFTPIGESNGYVYYYSWIRFKTDLKINVYKYNQDNLELVDTKEIFVKDIRPKVFNYHCKINAYIKNNKFYFFYSLLHSGDFHVGLLTVDESLSNTQDLQLGVIVETGYELLGDFYVAFSPDEKSAIVALKNRCERKKAIGTNTTTNFENTELVYVDLMNNKVNYSKRLPIELEEKRLSTSQYKTDNDGSVTCIASISDRNGGNVVYAVGIAQLPKAAEKLKINEIDVTGSTSISNQLIQAKNGDLVYIGNLGNKILFKLLPLDKSKKWLETNFSNKSSCGVLYKVVESQNGYFLNFTNDLKLFASTFISQTGELKWNKDMPVTKNYFKNYDLHVNVVAHQAKEYIVCTENKTELYTPKIQRYLDEGYTQYVYDFKNFQTVMYSFDENGMIEKKTVNTDVDFFANPSSTDFVSEKGALFMPLDGKKSYKLKKITIK